MAKEKKKVWLIAGFLLFVLYFFAVARPIPVETILAARWISSLETDYQVTINASSETPAFGAETPGAALPDVLIPFTLGNHYGFVNPEGQFSINRIRKGYVSLSENLWAEYGAEPELIEIRDNRDEPAGSIAGSRGYPLFLDGRIFLVGDEQNSLSEADAAGNILWTYEFAAPLTCVDAAAGLVLTGSLDGVVEVIDSGGKQIYTFEPGGSRYSVILGCAFSRDGSRFGVISGVDDQRFLLLEKFGNDPGEYKVVYHELLEDGFRRAVRISFIDRDRWIVFEREGGIGLCDLGSRRGIKIPLDDEVAALDPSGGDGFLFVVTSRQENQKKLIGIRLPRKIVMEAPFKSAGVFLGRAGPRIYIGGGGVLSSFELEKK
ncbi:MAG: WD40 repeat domain-containing protein [Treponema sp.]|nr:WD40 repeat domain-containing protein [Treponema sp.]